MADAVNHPPHYNANPSGVECIDVVEHMPFNIGNAMKYLWRAGMKGNLLQDLQKARWYVDREIQRLTATNAAEAAFPGGTMDASYEKTTETETLTPGTTPSTPSTPAQPSNPGETTTTTTTETPSTGGDSGSSGDGKSE